MSETSKLNKRICSHNYKKLHPDEDCIVCLNVEWYDKIESIRPDWDSVRVEKFTSNHQLGELPNTFHSKCLTESKS